METPEIDGNQEDQEKIDKKIIGRGFRPALKTPKNFPYPLELDHSSRYAELKFNEKNNRLYIGDYKYTKKDNEDRLIHNVEQVYAAFVEVHPKGLQLIINRKKYIIPGELSLAKSVNLLVERYIPIKWILEDSDIEKKYISFGSSESHTTFLDIADLTENVRKVMQLSALSHRKREISGALLANNIWQKRGFFDKEKVAPKNFWQVVPVEELILGDKRNLKKWWEDALIRSAGELPGIENYSLKPYQNEYEKRIEINNFSFNGNHLTEEEYAERKKTYRMRGIVEKNALLKPIRDRIKEGFLPEYPWEIRHWDKIPFEPLKKALLYGLHKMPEWEAYTKCGAPQIQSVIEVLQYGYVTEKTSLEEIVSNIGNGIYKRLQKNMFFQPFKTEIEEKIRQSLSLFTDGKILEGQNIIADKNIYITNKYGQNYPLWDKKTYTVKEAIQNNNEKIIDIFEEKRKNQFIVPDFACIDGWEWDRNGTSFLALETIKEQKKNYDTELRNNFSYGYSSSLMGRVMEKNELSRINSLKCIAIKNENGIQKEIILSYSPLTYVKSMDVKSMGVSINPCWKAVIYQDCDITDLRKIKIFCRTLEALKKELKPKINTDIITPDITKEKVIEDSLPLNSIKQSKKIGGR